MSYLLDNIIRIDFNYWVVFTKESGVKPTKFLYQNIILMDLINHKEISEFVDIVYITNCCDKIEIAFDRITLLESCERVPFSIRWLSPLSSLKHPREFTILTTTRIIEPGDKIGSILVRRKITLTPFYIELFDKIWNKILKDNVIIAYTPYTFQP